MGSRTLTPSRFGLLEARGALRCSIPVPDECMRRAYERRRRFSWPDGFERCVADPVFARLILMEALAGESHRIHRAGTGGELAAIDSGVYPPAAERYWWHPPD